MSWAPLFSWRNTTKTQAPSSVLNFSIVSLPPCVPGLTPGPGDGHRALPPLMLL